MGDRTLDASVFSFASGILRIVTEQECSSGGWHADLVTVRACSSTATGSRCARA